MFEFDDEDYGYNIWDSYRQENGKVKFEVTVDSMAGFGQDIIYRGEAIDMDEAEQLVKETGINLEAVAIYPVYEFTSDDDWARQFESMKCGDIPDSSFLYENLSEGMTDDERQQWLNSKWVKLNSLLACRNANYLPDYYEINTVTRNIRNIKNGKEVEPIDNGAPQGQESYRFYDDKTQKSVSINKKNIENAIRKQFYR